MLVNILIALVAYLLGAISGIVAKFLLKSRYEPQDIIDRVLNDFRPKEKGDIIHLNPLQTYLKEHEGDIALGDIIDEE